MEFNGRAMLTGIAHFGLGDDDHRLGWHHVWSAPGRPMLTIQGGAITSGNAQNDLIFISNSLC